jgi:streptogramin lyase
VSNVRRISIALFAGALLCLCTAVPAAAVTISTFAIQPGDGHLPGYIASSPTGELWFTDFGGAGAVRAINTEGVSLGAINEPAAPPTGDLAFAPNGDLYWASGSGFAMRKANGQLHHYTREHLSNASAVGFRSDGTARVAGYSSYNQGFYVCSELENCGSFTEGTKGRFSDLILGSDGHLWALQSEEDTARRLDSGGLDTELSISLPAGSHPVRAVVGPDGNLWIAAFGDGFTTATNTLNQIIRLSPTGEQKSFILPAGRGPDDITLGPDGALWFTEYLSNSIGRLTTSGEYSSCPLPNAASSPGPVGITTGSDGAIWFTEEEVGAIGRLSGGNCGLAPPLGLPSTVGAPNTVAPIVGPGATKTAPSLGALKVSPGGIDPKKGAKVTFTLSEPGTVSFTVQRKARGRKVGKSCKPQNGSNAANKACSRLLTVSGSLKLTGSAGRNSFAFKGRFGGHALAPGRYVLSGQATNAAGKASAAVTAPFSILE